MIFIEVFYCTRKLNYFVCILLWIAACIVHVYYFNNIPFNSVEYPVMAGN